MIYRTYFQKCFSREKTGETVFKTLDTNSALPVGVAAELPKDDKTVERFSQAWWEIQDLVQIFQFASDHSSYFFFFFLIFQSYRTAYHCYTTPTFAFVHVFLSRPGILSPSYSKPDQL